MDTATELQRLRLRTLAATRDITFGRTPMTRQERLGFHSLVCHGLSFKRADRLIAYWERAPLQLEKV